MAFFSLHLLLPGLFNDVKVFSRWIEVGVGVEQVRNKRQVQLLVTIFNVLNVNIHLFLHFCLSACNTLGVTNCLHPILSAWSSITVALSTMSLFCIADLFTPEPCKKSLVPVFFKTFKCLVPVPFNFFLQVWFLSLSKLFLKSLIPVLCKTSVKVWSI